MACQSLLALKIAGAKNTTDTKRIRRASSILVAAFSALCAVSSMAMAGSTPWLDRDDPSGVGDWEQTRDHLKIQCRLKGGAPIPAGAPGYHCGLPKGAWCENAKTKPINSCKDIEVKFTWMAGPGWAAGETPWLDRDNPGGVGDWEQTQDLLKIECRFKGGGPIPAGMSGYQCSMPAGASCTNSLTQPKNACKDMEVRFSW